MSIQYHCITTDAFHNLNGSMRIDINMYYETIFDSILIKLQNNKNVHPIFLLKLWFPTRRQYEITVQYIPRSYRSVQSMYMKSTHITQ